MALDEFGQRGVTGDTTLPLLSCRAQKCVAVSEKTTFILGPSFGPVLPVKTTRFAFWFVGQLFDTSPLLHFLSVSFLFPFGSTMSNV